MKFLDGLWEELVCGLGEIETFQSEDAADCSVHTDTKDKKTIYIVIADTGNLCHINFCTLFKNIIFLDLSRVKDTVCRVDAQQLELKSTHAI